MNKIRARPSFKKLTRYFKIGLIVLVILTALALIAAVINRSGEKSNIDLRPSVEQSYVPFGGKVIRYWDFEGYADVESSTDPFYASENIKVAKKYSRITFSEDNISLVSDSQSYTGTKQDAFFILGFETFSDFGTFSYYMIDADISVSVGYPYEIRFTPDFRGVSYSNESNGINSELCYINNQVVDRSGNVLSTVENGTFHLTYIFNEDSVALIYIDGKYAGTLNNIFKDNAAYCDGIKFTSYHNSYITDECSVSADNVVLTTFEPEYTGSLASLYDDPDVSLLKNSDSILYQAEFGYIPSILYQNSSIED